MTPNELTANRLSLAADTMEETLRYLDAYADLQARDHDTFHTHCSAILQLAIVCYCKSFISSNSRNYADPKIEMGTVELFADRQDLKECHDKLFEKRHKLIAHTEWEFHNTQLVDVYHEPESDLSSSFRKSQKHNPCSGVDVGLFYELAKLLNQEFDRRHFELDCSIHKESSV